MILATILSAFPSVPGVPSPIDIYLALVAMGLA